MSRSPTSTQPQTVRDVAEAVRQASFVDTPTRESSAELSTVELVTQLTEQSTRLLRDEVRLAKAELSASAKHAGLGAGMFGAAAVVAAIAALLGKTKMAQATPVPEQTVQNIKADVAEVREHR